MRHTIAGLAQQLHDKKVSSEELTQYYLDRIKTWDSQLNSFITVAPEQALAQARASDALRAKGQAKWLTGVPMAHKDIFCTKGLKTSCGSKMLDNFISPYDATVVENMAHAGLVCVGKTNMDEFAMGSSNETSFYGPCANPWDLTCVPGGSSGGSASAVAAGLVPAATGTDTGGSIRQPAAFTGITGLKPTYGRVSRYGMIAFASSLDQAGPMASSAEDCAWLMNAMAGFDSKDSTSVEKDVPDYTQALNQSLKGKVIGLPKEYFDERLDSKIADAVMQVKSTLEAAGATFKTVSLPNSHLAVPVYYIVAPAECSSNLSRYDGVRYGYRCDDPKDLMDLYQRSRAEGFGQEVKRRILVGTYALSSGYYDAYYLKAQKIRHLISDDFKKVFEEVDCLLAPTTPSVAFKSGEKSDPVEMYLSDVYTIAVNLAGLPALSMPMGFIDNMPVGAQLIGPHFEESMLLNVAHQYQSMTDWHQQVPTAVGDLS